MRIAAIGIGSNSLRMLVADVCNGGLKQVLRDREGLRVFAALSETNGGTIEQSMIDQACESIYKMKIKAQKLGSQQIHLFATSATRDASNKDEFLNAIFKYTGLKLDIISGDDEAKLSFLGSTMGGKAGMIDIGGGSTEIALGEGKIIDYAHSFQIGAVRLSRQISIKSSLDIDNGIKFAKKQFSDGNGCLFEILKKYKNQKFYGVGGTFTSAGAYLQNIPWNEYEKINGYPIKKEDAYRCLCELADMSLNERLKLISVQKSRADIIVYGLLILYTCMEYCDIDKLYVSTKGNLEGYIFVKNICS